MTSTRTKRRRAASRPAQERKVVKRVSATRYDVLTDRNNAHYWRWVDNRSVDASLDSETRRRAREKARYEVANNSYAMGCALAVSNAVVGSGPRVQILADYGRDVLKKAEWDFAEWQSEIRLAEKLRSMRFARFQDGESFAVLHSNPRLFGQVKLDVRPIDAERVCGEYGSTDPFDVDGILLDAQGNPTSYRVLTRHPGDMLELGGVSYVDDATIYPAFRVVHWYRRTSPEQHRGAPELLSSLNLFALLRRYTLAVVEAAETAADFAAILYTDAGGDYGQTPNAFETMNIERGLMMTAPEGWKVSQLKAEQPTTTYKEFKRELLGEIGRSLQIPVNIIAGDSSTYNYASGRLDHQEFQKAIRIDQAQCAISVMRPIFRLWWKEWALLNGLPTVAPPTAWYWDGFEHVDPVKEANAQAVRLQSLTTNLSIEYGKQGRAWEDELVQIARERDKMKELGLSLADVSQNTDDSDDSRDIGDNTSDGGEEKDSPTDS